METNKNLNDTLFYPKSKNNAFIGKKTLKYDKCFKDNPKINFFNLDSFFIYDQGDFLDYYDSLQQKNLIKLNPNEFSLLLNEINIIQLKISIKENETFIEMPKILLDSLNKLSQNQKIESEAENFIKNKIDNCKNRSEITCRKLSKLYTESTGKYISKSTVNNIIRDKLGYRFLKTTYKNNFLRSDKGTILCLCFIKVFCRLIKLGFNIIYLDESKIELRNTHLKCWRKKNETIYFADNNKGKINLIMAVGKNKVYKYMMNYENTDEKHYMEFLNELYIELKEEENKKFVIILDNLRVHKTKNIISYCHEKKMNLVFNVPYQSVFNCIELCFRAIKRNTYSKIYKNMDETKKDIENIIKSNNFKDILLLNYKETLQEYLFYEENHKYDNINIEL